MARPRVQRGLRAGLGGAVVGRGEEEDGGCRTAGVVAGGRREAAREMGTSGVVEGRKEAGESVGDGRRSGGEEGRRRVREERKEE